MKYIALAALCLTLSACVSGSQPPVSARPKPAASPLPTASTVPAKAVTAAQGVAAVMGKDPAALIRIFGQPRLDVVEPYGRKLQFTAKACVLDAYLYPKGNKETVTYIDTRRSDGAEVDREACVNALLRH